MDISSEAIELAETHYASDRINFKIGDVHNLDFPADFFDQIGIFQTIEHIQGVDQTLSELPRVLKLKGYLTISSYSRTLTSPGKSAEQAPDNIFHAREYSLREILCCLNKYFEIQEVNGQRGNNRFLVVPVIRMLTRLFLLHLFRPDNGCFRVTKYNTTIIYRPIALSCINS